MRWSIMDLKTFMNEERAVNRWFVLRVALIGALCGAAMAFVWFAAAAVGK